MSIIWFAICVYRDIKDELVGDESAGAVIGLMFFACCDCVLLAIYHALTK